MNTPVLLLGSTGYIGTAFKEELYQRGQPVHPFSTRGNCFKYLLSELLSVRPHLVINAAAYIPEPSVAQCDFNQQETIESNSIFPTAVACACDLVGIPLIHLSTGCLWNDGLEHREYHDPPQRSFTGPCGFYVGSKMVAEGAVSQIEKRYILRIRLPFDEFDHPRNYLSKLASFKEVYDHTNSLTHRGDFVKAALDLVEMGAPYGTYNCTNPGDASAIDILAAMGNRHIPTMSPVSIIKGPKTDCKLNVSKLLATGVKIRSVDDAVIDSLNNWKPAHV